MPPSDGSPVPLLLCSYRPRYLRAILAWFRSERVEERYRLFVWDNGGAADALRAAGLEWQCIRDESTGEPVNVGKALAMRYLLDGVGEALPHADCVVCMGDDIVVGRDHLDALVDAARRPGIGMVAGRFHRFQAAVPNGGQVGPIGDPPVLLRTFPVERRTVQKEGQVAGGLFAVSRASLARVPWAPHLYPVLTTPSGDPVTYWTEDASLDHALTVAGLVNGYLADPAVEPAIHLPELDDDYMAWKLRARQQPQANPVYPGAARPAAT